MGSDERTGPPATANPERDQHDQHADVAVADAIKAIGKELQTAREENNRRDESRYRLEKWAFGVLAFYSIVTFCQWRTTADSVRISARALMEAHRGKIVFGRITGKSQVLQAGPFSIYVIFDNAGSGVAKHVDSSGRELKLIALDPSAQCEQVAPPKRAPDAGASGDVAPGGHHVFALDGRLNAEQFFLIAERQCTLRIIGSVRYIAYTDLDNVPYPDATPFCQELVWNKYAGGGRWLGCTDFPPER
jgi:hypothetical protein